MSIETTRTNQVLDWLEPIGGDLAAAIEDVDDGGRLGRRSLGHPVEALLAGALGDVQDDRGAGPVELVLEVCAAGRQLFDQVVEQIEEVERAVIDVELGVIDSAIRP